MIIRKLTASYGRLQNSCLELSDGLNIVCAPNECGKSTWCSFIKNMLYGVDSAAREKGGKKPDKVRFAPWSGAPMSGSMELETGGRSITLSRSGRASAPMRELSAVITGTLEPAPELTEPPGLSLLGIPREVFERSAFIGQGAAQVSASPELEKRISSLVRSGDEDVSFTGAVSKLSGAMRQRRYRNSGQLPEIESQIDGLTDTLNRLDSETARALEHRAAVLESGERIAELESELAPALERHRESILEELAKARENVRRIEAERQQADSAAAAAEQKLKASPFGDLTPKQLGAKAKTDLREIKSLRDKLNVRVNPVNKALYFMIPAAMGALIILDRPFSLPGVFLLFLVLIGIIARRELERTALLRRMNDIFARYGSTNEDELRHVLARHERVFNEWSRLRGESEHMAKLLAKAQAELEKSENDLLARSDPPPDSAPAKIAKQLEDAKRALSRERELLAGHEGRLTQLPSRESLLEKIALLRSEHDRLEREYSALSLASEALTEAGVEIQNRLTPRLGQLATDFFIRLTQGRYDAVALDRSFHASARLTGDAVSHEDSFLSVGALEQLYLAVRLALCELALPGEERAPLILDDALTAFDDERARAALSLLYELSQERQIIVFTCHSREAKLLDNHTDVNIINLASDK
ncbi:MAG: AAA family ATPase [Oscillospiraceae bacterium]|jgi:uncharacterized protein YhaN|nr:AAA family ATPase [Oscillospiraceae bacterium]